MGSDSLRRIRTVIECSAIVIVVIMFFVILRIREDVQVVSFNTGWDITFRGETYVNQDVEVFFFPQMIKRGDEITICNTLPAGVPDHPSLSFLSYLSAVRIELDGKVVHDHGMDEYEKNHMVGSGYHRIRLPDDASGHEISITMIAAEDNAFTNIPPIEIVETGNMIPYFASMNGYNFLISVFLLMVGIVLPVTSIFLFFVGKEYERLILIGSLAFCMGTWSMCNTKVLQIFSTDLEWNTFVEYITLYVAPIPAMRLIDMSRSEKYRTRAKNIIVYASTAILGLFVVVSLVLHVTNVLHICQVLPYFHVIAAICIISCFAASFQPFSQLSRSDKYMYVAIITMLVTAVLDIIRFNFEVYIEKGFSFLRNSFLPLGTLFFIMLLIMGYLVYLYEHYIEQAEKKALQQRAYEDPLTGLYNRAYFEKELQGILDRYQNFGIISMDLNGLKSVNDTYGHASGDLLLNTFAGILKESFKGVGDIIRMGGDEFLVLLRDKPNREVARRLIKMDQLERAKSKELPFEIRTAFGEAYSNECKDKDPEAVYRLADARMYDMKRKAKARKVGLV